MSREITNSIAPHLKDPVVLPANAIRKQLLLMSAPPMREAHGLFTAILDIIVTESLHRRNDITLFGQKRAGFAKLN
jgi:hypothetical protein